MKFIKILISEQLNESITLNVWKNTEKAPNLGNRFGQDVEPHGIYVTNDQTNQPGWISGIANLNNPLYIKVTDDTLVKYKYDLADQYKAKGKKLTDKLMKLGYDAIITVVNGDYYGEIILFPNAKVAFDNKQLSENINSELILYHGTKSNFNNFDLKFFGSSDGGWLGYGVYLTNDYEYAESYGNVLECKVILKNPYVLTDEIYSRRPQLLNNQLGTHNSIATTKKLKELGYDSVILEYRDETRSWLDTFIEVCVFDPSNVKIQNKYKQGDTSREVNILRGY